MYEDKLDKLVSKLTILGDSVTEINSRTALIYRKSRVACYRLTEDDRIIVKEYESVYNIPHDTCKQTYLLAKSSNKYWVLSDKLDELIQFIGDTPISIVCDTFIVVKNNLDSSRKLKAFNDKSFQIRGLTKLGIYKLSNGKIIIKATEKDNKTTVYLINKISSLDAKPIANITASEKVYAGNTEIAFQFMNPSKIVVYDYNNQVRLVINSGKISIEQNKIVIKDKYSLRIKEIDCAEELYLS